MTKTSLLALKYVQIHLKLLWSVDEHEDDPQFSSQNKQLILNHDEIVKELIVKLAKAEEEEETEKHGYSPWYNTIHIQASRDSEVQQKGTESHHSQRIEIDGGDDDNQQLLEMGTRPSVEEATPYEDEDNEPTLSTKIVAVSVCLIFVRIQMTIVVVVVTVLFFFFFFALSWLIITGWRLPYSRET